MADPDSSRQPSTTPCRVSSRPFCSFFVVCFDSGFNFNSHQALMWVWSWTQPNQPCLDSFSSQLYNNNNYYTLHNRFGLCFQFGIWGSEDGHAFIYIYIYAFFILSFIPPPLSFFLSFFLRLSYTTSSHDSIALPVSETSFSLIHSFIVFTPSYPNKVCFNLMNKSRLGRIMNFINGG